MRQKTTAILVDGSNLHATYEALGLTSVDFKRVLQYFEGTILHAGYFTALPPKSEVSTLRPMVDYLEYNGWTIYQKEWKEFTDGDGNRKVKGNMDVEISVMAKELAPYVTHMVLFTGDGDFRFLVDAVQRSNRVHVTVVSSIKTRPAMCADILRRQADAFIDLVDLHPHIGRVKSDETETRRFKFNAAK
jgi:uncharacterized LabA/DUF88 family protein